MTKSTRRKAVRKPKKPYPDFPLFPHAAGVWVKKIRGRLYYFGRWDDPDGALQKYIDQGDDLHAGRTPRASSGGLTMRELVNRFLTSKKHLVDAGEIVWRTFLDYHTVCTRLIDAFGKDRLVDDLASDDFERLRANLAKTRGPVAIGNGCISSQSTFRRPFPVRFVCVFGVGPVRVSVHEAPQCTGGRPR